MRPDARVLLPVSVFLALATAGCESVDPMDHPFQPVAVASKAPATSPGAAPAGPADDRFAEFDAPFTLSSDKTEAPPEPVDVPEAVEPEALPEPPTEAPAPAPPAPVIMSTAPSAPMVAQVPAAPLGWAIRLVKTIPEAQPPRAIIGLPTGEEIVVTPGSMVPAAGLVVLSIGTQGVQVARVQATGDHATVEAMSLSPQY